MCLYIKDASNNYVYMRYLIGSAVNNPDIALYGYFAALEWNGLGNQGSYNGQPLPPGNYTVTLYINKSGYTAYETNPLTIVEIDKIECKIGSNWSGGYFDCPNPLVVAKGTDITFKAISDPYAIPSWPYGKPTWEIDSTPSGTGYKKTVSFNTASSTTSDYIEIKAECGNTKSINVLVVDLDALVVNANRVSGPTESSFPVKEGEHFELGATFQFDLMLGSWPTPVWLKCEIWDIDWIPEMIAGGWGPSITKVFGTGGHDDGDCEVRFYVDNNEDGDPDVSDPHKYSPEFKAQELTYHYLDFAKSSAVGGTPATTAACSAATALIRKKDTADDWRTTAVIMPEGDLSVIPASTHDPFKIKKASDGKLYFNSTCDFAGDRVYFHDYPDDDSEVFIVTDIELYDYNLNYLNKLNGLSARDYKYEIYLDSNKVVGGIIAHEVGHSCDLGDLTAPSEINRVMYYSDTGNFTILTQSEAAAFE